MVINNIGTQCIEIDRLILIKSGMQYEGTLRQYLLHNDSFDDCIMYAALKEEYSG